MKALTDRQQEVFDFIVSACEKGMPPTRREIADHFGWNINGAECHLTALEKKGFVGVSRNTARGIDIFPQRPFVVRADRRGVFVQSRKLTWKQARELWTELGNLIEAAEQT